MLTYASLLLKTLYFYFFLNVYFSLRFWKITHYISITCNCKFAALHIFSTMHYHYILHYPKPDRHKAENQHYLMLVLRIKKKGPVPTSWHISVVTEEYALLTFEIIKTHMLFCSVTTRFSETSNSSGL